MQRLIVESKFAADPAGKGKDAATFSGLAAVFGNIDHGGDIIMPGAFTETLKRNPRPKMLLQHGYDDTGMAPVGRWDDLGETDAGLESKGTLFLETEKLRLTHRAMREGELNGLSIGYIPKVWEWNAESGVRILKEVELLEISIVTFPMNELARVHNAKSCPNLHRIAAGLEPELSKLSNSRQRMCLILESRK